MVGRIPTADYPTSVTLDSKGKHLYVTNAFGDGPQPNVGLHKGQFNDMNGTLSTVKAPSMATLRRLTAEVGDNNHTTRSFDSTRPPGSPIPLLGGRSPIKHVIYIVKENQTYDHVFGDIKNADGDRYLTRYGRRITPNLHALALHFGIFDNFYDDGRSSSDGHNWVMSADDADFNQKMWPKDIRKGTSLGSIRERA